MLHLYHINSLKQEFLLSPRRSAQEHRLQYYEERVRDVEQLLAIEKDKASAAEVSHLQAVVKWCVLYIL